MTTILPTFKLRTEHGETLVGALISATTDQLVLLDINGTEHTFSHDEVDLLVATGGPGIDSPLDDRDTDVILRTRSSNLALLRAPADQAPFLDSSRPHLVEIGANTYRLYAAALQTGDADTATATSDPVGPLEVMRAAGVAGEVDELFLGGASA